MKFGKRLRALMSEEWKEGYVDYKGLKKYVKQQAIKRELSRCESINNFETRSYSRTGPPIKKNELQREIVLFERLLHEECRRVNSYFFKIMSKITTKAFQPIASRLGSEWNLTTDTLHLMVLQVLRLSEKVDALRRFVVLNYLALIKILKKFDKSVRYASYLQRDWKEKMEEQPFCSSQLDDLYTETAALTDRIMMRLLPNMDPINTMLATQPCPVCLVAVKNPITLSCEHAFCWSCLAKAKTYSFHQCPICRKEQSLDPRDYEVDGLLKRFIVIYETETNTLEAPHFSTNQSKIHNNHKFNIPSPSSSTESSAMRRLSQRSAMIRSLSDSSLIQHELLQILQEALAFAKKQYNMSRRQYESLPTAIHAKQPRYNQHHNEPEKTAKRPVQQSLTEQKNVEFPVDKESSYEVGTRERSVSNFSHIKPMVIAHRGASGHCKGNTIKSFEKTIELGADMVEVDVQICASGEIVVYHDQYVCSGELVRRLTLNELQEMDADIPKLEEVMDMIKRRVRIYFDLKGENIVQALMKALETRVLLEEWDPSSFYIASFNHYHLIAVNGFRRRNAPLEQVKTIILTSSIPLGYAKTYEQLAVSHVALEYAVMTPEFLADIHARGMKSFIWTVNSKRSIERCMEFYVDGIVSDFPDRVRDCICQKQKSLATAHPTTKLILEDTLQTRSFNDLKYRAVECVSHDEYAIGDPVQIVSINDPSKWYSGVVINKKVEDEASTIGGSMFSSAEDTTEPLPITSYSVLWWMQDNSQRRASDVSPLFLRRPVVENRSYFPKLIETATGAFQYAAEWSMKKQWRISFYSENGSYDVQ